MKVNKKYKGLVTKKFNEFYLVELDKDATSVVNKKFLCKIKKSVNFRNLLLIFQIYMSFVLSKSQN